VVSKSTAKRGINGDAVGGVKLQSAELRFGEAAAMIQFVRGHERKYNSNTVLVGILSLRLGRRNCESSVWNPPVFGYPWP
jgi:hypothetical protein